MSFRISKMRRLKSFYFGLKRTLNKIFLRSPSTQPSSTPVYYIIYSPPGGENDKTVISRKILESLLLQLDICRHNLVCTKIISILVLLNTKLEQPETFPCPLLRENDK